MSLLRLLTAGKSLVGLNKTSSRYRMHPQFLLPKFGAGRNPFASPPPAPPTQSADAAPEAPACVMSPAEIAAANLKETTRLPAAVSTTPPTADCATSSALTEPGWISRWAQKISPLAWWTSRRPVAKPVAPRFVRTPLQGELSLDKVTVVRNDLSDADVEIVPMKPNAEPKPKVAGKVQSDVGLLKT